MAGKGIELASAYISLSASTDKIPGQIKQALHGVDKQSIDVDVDVDTKGASENLSRWRAEEESNHVNVKVDVDRSELTRVANDFGAIGTEVGNISEGLGSLFKTFGSLSVVGELPALATGIATLGGAVEQLAGAGAALPGVFAGLGSSFGVAKLGTLGLADALQGLDKASDGTAKSIAAANAAVAKLAPNAQAAVRTVYGLKPAFDDLQQLSQNNLFAGVSDSIKALAQSDLPALRTGVDGISKSLNQNLTQLLQSLGSDSSKGLLERILGNTAEAQGKFLSGDRPAGQRDWHTHGCGDGCVAAPG
jgi:hypothetical protein